MAMVGIESMNAFGGVACLDVRTLAEHRGLSTARFDNLLMHEKAIALPWEDAVTFGATAARPLLEAMSAEERDRIELLITCSESGIDFGKSLSTYVHQALDLHRRCRLFEIKQACYAATAGLQMACNFILSQTSPGAKALVVASDVVRGLPLDRDQALSSEWSYAELSGGAGGVACVVSDTPHVFQLDVGASGYYGYEVMDTCRPIPDMGLGDPDLSLWSYLDCCEQTFAEYRRRVSGADFVASFQYLAFHTPFGGMVKGAHRTMMRKTARAAPQVIEADFDRRVAPGLVYGQRIGNIMSGSVLLSLISTLDHAAIPSPRRVGCFSYGSGCCAEFYSGIVTPDGQRRQRRYALTPHLDARHALSIEEYEALQRASVCARFGTRNATLDANGIAGQVRLEGRPRLVLRRIVDFHREYAWIA